MSEGAEGASAVRIVWPEDPLWPQGGYANVMLVNHTPFDFTLRLAHVVLPALPPGERPEGTVEVMAIPIAQITLPPPTFRQLALVIQQQVATYVQTYGEIGGAPPEQGIT